MFIIILLIAVANLALSAPALPSTTSFDLATPLTILGRELPDCINVMHCRTIQDIIWSCLATIFACTWVAVHLKWKKLKKRAITMVYAILTPEFMIIWALSQRIGAAEHMREYNKKFYPNLTPPSHSIWWNIKRRFHHPESEKPDGLWTITHGFLLEMHGLVDSSGKNVCSIGGVLEDLGVRDLQDRSDGVWASHEVPEICDILDRLNEGGRSLWGISGVLDISEEEISDKSKGDSLTKLLVVLQTSWFMLQCLARWIAHLPVTKLEAVTLAYALLNIGTYILWWNKPQNMSVAIRMDRHENIKDLQRKKRTTGAKGKNTRLEMSLGDGEEIPLRGGEEVRCVNAMHGTPSEGEVEQNADEGCHIFGSKSSLKDQGHQRHHFLTRAAVVVKQSIYRLSALRFLGFNDVTFFVPRPFGPPGNMVRKVKYGDNSVCGHVFYSSGSDVHMVLICLLIVGTGFGGLHIVPLWLSSFPSSSEKLLWQLSAGLITVAPFLGAALFLLAFTKLEVIEGLLELCITGVCGLYLVARIILVVLAFTTLRELPPDAFRNITWTTFLPHF